MRRKHIIFIVVVMFFTWNMLMYFTLVTKSTTQKVRYEGQSKITEPYLITFELSKMDIYLDDISLKLYVIYLIAYFISVGRLFLTVARQQIMSCQRDAFTLHYI